MVLKRRNFLTAGGLAAFGFGSTFGIGANSQAREIKKVPQTAGTITVLLKTTKYAPPAEVSIDSIYKTTNLTKKIKGFYRDGNWIFAIPTNKDGEEISLTFMLDGKKYNDKSSQLIKSNSGSLYQFDCYEVTLSLFDELAQTRNVLADRLFVQENIKENYDVVVVGSGMGGGVLANRLADIGLNVAVLEAGSMLFPTHVGNLPRMTKLGLFSKHIWSLWSRYALKNYQSAKNSQYDGGQGYNLGGRSLFWGAFIPEMREYEFHEWPPEVKDFLLNEGYDSANKLVKKSTYTDCEYQVAAKEYLASRLKNINLIDAPLAIDYAKSACQPTLPTGVFSTADLVVEAALTGVESKVNYPKIFQRHPAISVETAGSKVTGIKVIDLDKDEFQIVKGKAYVLAAGSQESAKLAINSNLEPKSVIGRGFSDHPVFYTHFGISKDNPLYREDSAAKFVVQAVNSTSEINPFNILIELGADLNHGRFSKSEFYEMNQKRKELMLCELVVLINMPLDNNNGLTMESRKFYEKPIINMQAQPGITELIQQAAPFQKQILNALNAKPLGTGNLDLQPTKQGWGGHEVGTLRMGAKKSMQDLNSVVDSDLKFHLYDNLWACDNSVFPSSPAANPGLTLIGLALRLADRLARTVN